jgi:hypothetical protein
MSVFLGGSAYSMVKDIAEGYVIVSENTFKKFQPVDLQNFMFEVEKLLRDVRGTVVTAEDAEGVKKRNRKMQRLNQAATLVSAFRLKYRR